MGQPPGWDKVGGGREVKEGGDICIYTYGWFIVIHGRNHHSIVKQLFFN